MRGFPPITSLPHFFFVSVEEIASRHRADQFAHGGKTISVSFEEFKEKDPFFVREWLRQEGLENSARYSCIVR